MTITLLTDSQGKKMGKRRATLSGLTRTRPLRSISTSTGATCTTRTL